jgi:hypothetical protein
MEVGALNQETSEKLDSLTETPQAVEGGLLVSRTEDGSVEIRQSDDSLRSENQGWETASKVALGFGIIVLIITMMRLTISLGNPILGLGISAVLAIIWRSSLSRYNTKLIGRRWMVSPGKLEVLQPSEARRTPPYRDWFTLGSHSEGVIWLVDDDVSKSMHLAIRSDESGPTIIKTTEDIHQLTQLGRLISFVTGFEFNPSRAAKSIAWIYRDHELEDESESVTP